MLRKTRADYLALRRQFTPEKITLVIIAESPPASGLYFYDPEGAVTEPLFAALLKHLGISCKTKDVGLREFQRIGWYLVDATYSPVNKLSHRERDRKIEQDYPLLRDDLQALTPDRLTPLVLIKANVCRILEPRLLNDGFKVINQGRSIRFPGMGHQNRFHEHFREAVNLNSNTVAGRVLKR